MANNQNFNQRTGNPLGNIGVIAMAILALVALFFLAKIAFNIIYIIAPILFIATLVIDYKVVINYGKWVLNLFKTNLLYGIGASLITFLIYPVVAIFLFGKAMFNRKLEKIFKEEGNGDYVEYEEIPEKTASRPQKRVIEEEDIVPEKPLIELPPIKPREKQKPMQTNKNDYENLFDE